MLLILRMQSAMEDWLYGDGEDTTKSTYMAKLDELKAVGGPIQARADEEETRGGAAAELKKACQHWWNLAKSEAPGLAHIGGEERAQCIKECEDAMAWLSAKEALQAQAPKWEAPVLVTADIVKKREVVERVCKPIMSKSAPKPAAPPPAPAEPAAQAAAAEPTPMDAEAEAAAAAAAGAAEEAPMEQ